MGAASVMFSSQSETWSSLNYRLMTQSRYGEEAGLHAAANYLMTSYTQPLAGSVTDPISAYDLTVSPVTLIGNTTPIVLGPTMNLLSANYPVGTVLTGFNTATQKSLTAGNTTLAYSLSPELLSIMSSTECQNFEKLHTPLWKLTS